MRGIRAAAVFAVLTLAAGLPSASADNYAQQSLDRSFRIEFEVGADSHRPTISGYVHNLESGYFADRMTLVIDRLDASGRVVGSSTTWVLGGVPPGNRAYFSARVEPAASYRIRVNSFDWIGRGGGSGS
jgi:hypothetical protein